MDDDFEYEQGASYGGADYGFGDLWSLTLIMKRTKIIWIGFGQMVMTNIRII